MGAPENRFTIGQFLNSVRSLPGNPDQVIIRSPGTGITVEKWELEQWADPNDTTDNSIVDLYLGMICNYVNLHAGGVIRQGGVFPAPPDVYYEPSRFYRGLLDLPGGHILAAIDLEANGVNTDMFRQIQYFFLPMAVQAHWSLVVISPIDRTVEILDSTSSRFHNWAHRARNVYIKVFQFLEYFLGPHFVPAQWRTMDDQSPQQLPNDNNNCGYFVCRFAFSIACREPLDPQSYQNDYLWGQRSRIGAEVLHRRFTGKPASPFSGRQCSNIQVPQGSSIRTPSTLIQVQQTDPLVLHGNRWTKKSLELERAIRHTHGRSRRLRSAADK